MKCVSLIFLTVLAGYAQQKDFSNGMAARALIGQTFFTRQEPGASRTLVGGVSGVAVAGDILVVADSNRVGASPQNNRVLVFKNLSSMLPAPTAELFYERRCPVCVGEASVVLGQPDFAKTDWAVTQSGMRTPTAVATDGTRLVVADTDNNRVLIWNTLPTANAQPANIVLGQPNFTSSVPNAGSGDPRTPSQRSLRGPQGVWIQGNRLFVADTQNNRVLIWNSFPTANHANADVVLGTPNFTTFIQPDLTLARVEARANTMLNPVSVTSDGQRVFVSDLGHNRILIWNSIPSANQAPADVVVGQPDMESAGANDAAKLCDATGKDSEGKDTFPARCEATLSFPRYALSDGTRLFIADGGNDRVLIYNRIPVTNGQKANTVIGQLGGLINQASDAADSMRAPMSLAWDGTNLFVGDAFNRRVMVYTPAPFGLPYTAVRNSASREIFAVGTITLSGTLKENDEITVKIKDREYKYKQVKDDSFDNVITQLVDRINAGSGDADVFATPNRDFRTIILTARAPGSDGNLVEYSATTSTGATILATTAGAQLSGGQDAAQIAPGTVVDLLGFNLADQTLAADPEKPWPTELGGVHVYFDGIRAPVISIAPDVVRAQVPWELLDTTSINAFVRTVRRDGSVTVTNPVAATIVAQNPGIYAELDRPDPRPGFVYHSSSFATGTVSVDGSVKAGDIATVSIEEREYKYTVKEGDTLATIRDALIGLINEDPKVEAFGAGVFTRIRLRARVPGPEGNGLRFTARANDGAQVILTATNSALCCANEAGARVTLDNPAVPGETVIVYATGLGLTTNLEGIETGNPFGGPDNEPREFVSSLAGGKTANVLFAGMRRGSVGVFEVHLELNSDIPTNPFTQMTIAQSFFVSNIVTFPVVNPAQAPE